jgi:LuxR family maltose regulon positive regulatory protein
LAGKSRRQGVSLIVDGMTRGPEGFLIASKLRPPRTHRVVVPRVALLARLSRDPAPKLTVVSAPAGAGKTTVLADWCASAKNTCPAAWLAVDAGDNDPVRFWSYAIEALRTVIPQVGATGGMLRAPRIDVVSSVLPVLLNRIDDAGSRSVLVIDDYHLIANGEIHRAVGFLLEHLPPALRVVVASRSDPPLPLARLRVSGELEELHAADLRFSVTECEGLLNGGLALELDEGEVVRLQRHTEGWAAGLCLAALSLRDQPDAHAFIDDFAGDDHHVVDYLVSEVLDALPEDVSIFLLHTSVLGRLCGPLCDAVTERGGSADLLERIERSNQFLLPLDNRRRWYRYHHLFAEAVYQQLVVSDPELIPELHRRASDWYRAAGLISDAVGHASAANAFDEASELIVTHWNAFVNDGQVATVDAWLDALPPPVIDADARLCLARGWMAPHLGRRDQVEHWLDAARRADSAGPIRDGTASINSGLAMLEASHRHMTGDVGAAAGPARRAVELEAAGTTRWRTVAHANLGVNLYWRGQHEEAIQELETAIRLAERPDGNYIAGLRAFGCRAAASADLGHWEETDCFLHAAGALRDQHGLAEYWVNGMVVIVEARLLVACQAYAEGDAAFARGIELARRGDALIELAYGLLLQAHLACTVGDSVMARSWLYEAGRIVAQCADPGTLRNLSQIVERRLRGRPGPHIAHSAGGPVQLSRAEIGVVRLLAMDLPLAEIADRLYLSRNTVKTHLRTVYRKLGVSSRAEAVARAHDLGVA